MIKQRILVLVDATIPWADEDTSITWPLPPALRFTKVGTAAMYAERMQKEARTCIKASLVLIGENGQVNASDNLHFEHFDKSVNHKSRLEYLSKCSKCYAPQTKISKD